MHGINCVFFCMFEDELQQFSVDVPRQNISLIYRIWCDVICDYDEQWLSQAG